MTAPPLPGKPAPPASRTLRRLFLTLFLRGRSSRGLRKQTAPRSVGSKLALMLLVYGVFGCMAFVFIRQPIFTLSIYLHGLTFVFLGMFVAASSGEVLFNKEEADILLHRPIKPRELLWAKISVLVQVALWLAAALNLAGFFAGVFTPDGGWLYPIAHVLSTVCQALFCTACVILAYQLCLRWFGREKLDGIMTTVQVIVAVGAALSGQLIPHLIRTSAGSLQLTAHRWWLSLLPPAWFAGLDDVIAGSRSPGSFILAAAGLLATALVLWLAFGKLAGVYETGIQALSETISKPPKRTRRRLFLSGLVNKPPLRWWLRDPVSRASFSLTIAYLCRDRDVKLRVYPGLAPVLVMPLVFLLQGSRGISTGSFGLAFSSSYLGLMPLLALDLLKYSQQWQASDLFRVAPISGPAPLCHGARRAVLLFFTLPLLLLFSAAGWALGHHDSSFLLLLPGIIALPIYSLIPCLGGKAVPLSKAGEEAKAAGRAVQMVVVMVSAGLLAGAASAAWSFHWFWWLILAETLIAIPLYLGLRASVNSAGWEPID